MEVREDHLRWFVQIKDCFEPMNRESCLLCIITIEQPELIGCEYQHLTNEWTTIDHNNYTIEILTALEV